MAKNLNTVSLAFTANTNEAIAAIKSLQKELNNLSKGTSLKNNGISEITPEIQRAMVAAGELQAKLEAATNLKTGKLDLGQFSDSLKKGGVSLQQYANQLNALGPAGRQAFSNLATSIMQAEAPLIRCNSRLKELGTTLANTARWQISSSILHGFMGAAQNALGYAKDLNKTLNDIRIVSEYNANDMAQFAIEANKAARALSTTTNEYAKASLIFFQQGDLKEEAMTKANIVAKMANVTGQSAEVVSDQLTSIWNNFNKSGTESYEKYADILTKLGAATASSTDEIAGGLEKFAGIATTIGLSYEYAASALATITATSRESEDTVGNALKTIFARIQGLNLGETLEDGTTLNKYSEALQKVGVSIYDQEGELKQMDSILQDLAAKWDTLGASQQTALAQTVAGVRQYSHFMTLMNNWDFMEDNLQTTREATGELERQNKIYEEGWQAARKRVTAAAEALYSQILDDDFFVGFLDGFAKVIDGVGGVIEAFGGLKGVLLTVGAFATKLFHKEIAEGLRNVAYTAKQFIPGLAKKEQEQTKNDTLKAMESMRSTTPGEEGKAENKALQREVQMQRKLQQVAKELSEEELKQLQLQMDTVRAMDERAIAAAKIADATREEAAELEEITRAYAKIEAKDKVRKERKGAEDEAREKGQNSFVNGLIASGRDSTITGHGTASKHDFLRAQYKNAVSTVSQEMGTDSIDVQAPEIQEKIRQAFINGINAAAEDGSDKVAQRFAQSYQTQITEAGNKAVDAIAAETDAAINEAVQQAEAAVNKLKKNVDAATGTQARANDLKNTASQMKTTNADGSAKSVKELTKLHEILEQKIASTAQEAKELQSAIGGVGKDTGLDDAINELNQLQTELDEAGADAKKLDAILAKLNAEKGTKGTVSDQLSESAGELGRDMAVGYFGEGGQDSHAEEFYQASKKEKTAQVKSENANRDADSFDEGLDESFEKAGAGAKDWADGIANATNIVMGLGSAITSVQGAIDVFNNPDASNWDKFSAVMSVIIGLLPVMSTLFTTAGAAGTAAGAGMTAAMGPVGWIILAVVAAVAALTAAFIALSNAYNRDAINAKKAAENAEKLAEASDKAKQQLEGIRDGFDAYDTAVEKLNNCVRGTDEWNAALKEVNDTVLGLLETYPELLGQKDLFTRNADGMLEINKETRENILAQAETQANVAQAAALVGQARAAEMNAISRNTTVSRDIGSHAYYNQYGDYMGSVNAGKIMTENKDVLAGLTPDEFRAKLEELIVKPAGMLDSEYQAMITNLEGYRSSIDSLVTATENAATQMDNATMLLANQYLGEEYGATETAAAAQAYEEAQDQIYKDIIKMDADNNAQIDGKTQTAEKIWDRFQAATGITHELADNAIQGDDNNRVYAYKDETGKEQTYSIEYIAQTIAAAEAMEAMGTAAQDAANLLSQLSESGTAFAAALGSGTDETSMANFLSGMTQAELDAIGAGITTDENGNATLTQEGLDALGLTAEQFEQLATTFGISVQDLTNNLAAAHETVNESLSDDDKAYFSDAGIDTSGMTIGEQKNFLNKKNALNTQATDLGIQDGLVDSIIAENADLEPEQLLAFMDGLSGINLQAEDASEQIANLAAEYGIQGDSILGLTDAVQGLDQVYNVSTQSIQEQAKSLKDIVGEGLKNGDVVSEEDIQKLRDAGVDVDSYFSLMADGTYSLTGKAEEFNTVVGQITFDALKKQWEDFNKAEAQVLEEYNSGAFDGKIRDTTSVHAGDKASKQGTVYTESGAERLGQARLDYINSFDKGTFNFTDEQNQLLADYTANPEMDLTAEQLETIAAMIDTVNAKCTEMETQMFTTATSLSQLGSIANELGTYSLQAYANGLINLGSQYDICSQEINDYQNALMSGDQKTIESAQKALEASIQIGEAAEKYGLNAEEVKTQAALMADEFNLSAEAAAELAIQNQRMNEGVAALSENWKDWKKTLTTVNKDLGKVDKTSKDYAKALTQVNKAVKQLTGVHDDFEIPKDFYDMPGVMEDIDKAAEGDIDAINRLGLALAEASVQGMDFNSSFVDSVKNAAAEMGKVDPFAGFNSFETNKQKVIAGIQDLQTAVANGAINVGDSVGSMGADWATSLNQMAMQTGMSVEQMNSLLSSMGVDAEVITEYVPQTVQVPVYRTEENVISEDPLIKETKTWQTGMEEMEGVVPVAQINMGEGGKGPDIKYVGNGSVAPSSTGGGGGGGGGGSTKKTDDERQKKDDMVDRYKQVDDKLDDVAKHMDKASKAADRLWGPARLKAMRSVNDLIEDEIDLLKSKKEEADQYLIDDKRDLNDAASDLGLSFKFDGEGNISNYEAQMTKLYEDREKLLDSFGSEMDEDEQERLAEFDEKIETLKDAISQYDETRELSEDLEAQIQDKIYEWQDNNYEMLNIELEFKLDIEDSKLEMFEYYLGKIEDDIYSTAEAFTQMNNMVDSYTNKLAAQEEYVKELERAYYAGEISMDAYKEGLREAQSATIENLQALQEQKEAMQDYYGNVMDMALEEIALYTDEMEELNSVLDHYSNIMEIVGKQEDFATKGKILNSKANNLRNEMQVQQELYERSSAEAEKWAEKMANAVEGSNEYETYKKNWIAAQEAANEAQDAMLSKTEEWAEAMKAVVENELAGLAKTMEESLTGGTSFDELLTSMERRSSLQEEYLTTTNQIYETNKLMRQAQQEIDKSSNSVAKRKLQNFINETAQMQEQSELSQYELDIQQAKYDLLLAEIALEEAQSAKSTVRLQRDSEGNFGYVYTADQNAVNDAEQELADKQNALYNIGLEGANDYSQKYAETMQEAQDAITELTQMWMNGEIESEEEYQRRKAEIQDYYYEKLKQYSNLYQVALTTDSNVIKDAWSTDFGDMMYKTEDWKASVDTYFEGAAESMQTWAEVCGTVLEESGLDDVSKKVEEIDTKSNKLKETLIGEDGESGVVGAMMDEVEAAGKLSESYINIQNQIDEVIKKYEEMMGVINEDYTDTDTPVVDPAIQNDPPSNPPADPEPPTTPAAQGPTYQTGTLTWTGNGSSRVWKDSSGKSYKYGSAEQKAIQKAFDKAYGANGGYKGDYFLGWNKLDADVLHKKYGLATGGYTGDWEGSYGKLAFLHQKELVLNANDTENFLAGMDLLDKIVSAIDLYSMNSQLGGALSSPSLGNMGGGEVLEQQVHIEASFPAVQDRNEIEEAFNTLINRASQYANRK